jgi:hypothetical protein
MNDRADLRERLRRAADWILPQPWSQWTSDISADRLLIDPGDAESGDRRARRIAWDGIQFTQVCQCSVVRGGLRRGLLWTPGES